MRNLPEPISVLIPELPDGWYLSSYKILSCGHLAIVTTDFDSHAAWKNDREQETVGSLLRFSSEATAKIWIFDGETLAENISFPLLEPFPVVEQFPDGKWLVAGTISEDIGNTRIFRVDGVEERRIQLGHHISYRAS